MPKPKPNPLYKKLPGEDAKAHMLRLRKEFPKKFGKQPGTKQRPTRKFTQADMDDAKLLAAKKAEEKVRAEIQSAPPQPAAAPAPAPILPPASVAPASTFVAPDTELFSAPPPPKPADPAASESPPPPPAGSAAPPGPESSAPPPAPDAAQSAARYAVMIWTMIVQIFGAIFGRQKEKPTDPTGWEPMSLKNEKGETLYDENAEGVRVWGNYLTTLGIKAFSPVVELWLFMGQYVLIRFSLIIARFRRKKAPKETVIKSAAETAEPNKSGTTPPPTPGSPPSTPAAPIEKPAPASPAPERKIEIVEVESNAEFL